jgi:uncharacterized protein with HEPN domain
MTRRRLTRPALEAILESIAGIEGALRNQIFDDYRSNWIMKHAVEHGIEIIAEAAKRLPPGLLALHAEVPWKSVIGIGNVLRHDYDEIVDRIIYDAATKGLPILKAAITAMDANLDEPR